MRIISKKVFNQAVLKYPQCRKEIEGVWLLLKVVKPNSSKELKNAIPSLDNFKYVDDWWVIDVAGGTLRLVLSISFTSQIGYVVMLDSHSEYDKLIKKYRH